MNPRIRLACGLVATAGALLACSDPLQEGQPAVVAGSQGQPAVVAGSQVVQTRFRFDREAASVEWTSFDPTGELTAVGTLLVGRSDRSDSDDDPRTFLFYAVGSCAAGECTLVEGGQGLIPNNHLAGGKEHLHLSTDTRDNPDMLLFAGTGGRVSVDIKAVSVAWQTFRGIKQFRFRPSESCKCSIVRREHGATTATLATARGSVVDADIDVVQHAGIETGRTMTMEIIR
jgi:hypothetical protein